MVQYSLGLCTVCNTGTAIMNTGQTGENQMEMSQVSFWEIPNSLGQV
jgi:hypothetical protein